MKKVCLLFLFCCFLSCEMQPENATSDDIQIYSKIVSSDGNCVNCQVKVVGSDGNALSGAIATAVNPVNKTVALEYSNGVYKGYFDALISGEYRFFIKAVIQGETKNIERTISHTVIAHKPKIQTIADSTGASALNGAALSNVRDITIGWEKIEGSVFVITVQTDSTTVYTANTKENYFQIPAETLSAGTSYSVFITAQYLDGDPFLYLNDYASQSSYSGASVYFRTDGNET